MSDSFSGSAELRHRKCRPTRSVTSNKIPWKSSVIIEPGAYGYCPCSAWVDTNAHGSVSDRLHRRSRLPVPGRDRVAHHGLQSENSTSSSQTHKHCFNPVTRRLLCRSGMVRCIPYSPKLWKTLVFWLETIS